MLIEFTGCTGSGKSILSQHVIKNLKNKGKNPILLNITGNFKFDIYTLPWSFNYFLKNINLLKLVIGILSKAPINKYNLLNLFRNFIKKIGTNQLIRSKFDNLLIIWDEGTIHSVHNILVHDNHIADNKSILEFVQLLPKPDILIYIKSPEEVLIAETLKRGHRRINKAANIPYFIKNAIMVFETIASVINFNNKLLVVENLHCGSGEIEFLAENIVNSILDEKIWLE